LPFYSGEAFGYLHLSKGKERSAADKAKAAVKRNTKRKTAGKKTAGNYGRVRQAILYNNYTAILLN